jgi:hypothetical protein
MPMPWTLVVMISKAAERYSNRNPHRYFISSNSPSGGTKEMTRL